MKVVILAGGLGTRLAEETEVKPKPMVEIGGQPILWHIMKHYAHHGFNEFYIALGYRGDDIKRYFRDYHSLSGDLTVSLRSGAIEVHGSANCEDWTVHLVDTGPSTHTGGRVRRLREHLRDGTFMVTYGDGVSDIPLPELLRFHREHGRVATLTAVRPPARFGGLLFEGDIVSEFTEKPQIGEGWINGGFLVFEPALFEYLHEDSTSLEAETMARLAADGQLAAYRHDGFWQCMDTVRDLRLLQSLWQSGAPPWKVWA
jgi:glucose-1-phosphate cytidylyltransferase